MRAASYMSQIPRLAEAYRSLDLRFHDFAALVHKRLDLPPPSLETFSLPVGETQTVGSICLRAFEIKVEKYDRWFPRPWKRERWTTVCRQDAQGLVFFESSLDKAA
jgi:hypothetical protein